MPTPLRPVTVDHIYLEWLRREYPRRPDVKERVDGSFGPFVHLITHPNLNDPSENAIRKGMFYVCRTSNLQWLETYHWYETELLEPDFEHLMTLPFGDVWLHRSNGTLLVSEAARMVWNPRTAQILQSMNDGDWVQTNLSRYANIPRESGKLIIIVEPAIERPYVLEGNHQAVQTYMYYKLQPGPPALPPISSYVGSCQKLTDADLSAKLSSY